MKCLWLCFVIFSAVGCSSIYYFPVKEELVDRTKMPIKPEDVYFESEDGTKLHGWYFSAQNLKAEEKPKAVILFFHGNAQNLSTHFYALYTAPEHGYDYFIFDYRGYGHSEGRPTPRGTVMDGRAAMRYMKKRNPESPLVVFGQSLGGAISLKTVLTMKNEIAVDMMIVDSTFASYRSIARRIFSRSYVTWLFQPMAWLIANNTEAPLADLKKLAPTPLIVIHGNADGIVDHELGRELFEAASEPKEFWEVDGGRHTDFMWQGNGLFAKRFYDTLDKKFAVAINRTLAVPQKPILQRAAPQKAGRKK